MNSCVECPDYLLEVLQLLKDKLSEVNNNDGLTPFDNSGSHFKNDVFEVQAYDWSEKYQRYNFKYNNIEISWYKYLGRMTTVNRDVTYAESSTLFNDCINSLIK